MVTHALPVDARQNRGGSIAPVGARLAVSRKGADLPASTYGWERSRSQRVPAAAAVLLLHAAVIALVMWSRSTDRMNEQPGLMAFDIPPGGERQPHRHVARPRRPHVAVPVPPPLVRIAAIAPVPSLPDFPAVADISAQDVPAAVGGGCDLTQPVEDALRNSADVRQQLPAIPSDRRSVANAVVLWNAGWSDPGTAPAQAAFATIRQTITQAVAAASADCRNQLQRGPRLVYLPGAPEASGKMSDKVIVLALGSGQWTWQQLVDGQPLPTGDPGPAATAPRFATVQRGAAAPGETPALNALLASLIRNRSPTALPYTP